MGSDSMAFVWACAKRARRAAVGTVVAAALISPVVADGVSASTPKENVLVRVQPNSEASVAAIVQSLGGEADEPLSVISGFRAEIPVSAVPALRVAPDVISVVEEADLQFDVALYDQESVSSSMFQIALNIGVDELWEDGWYGQGVDVAVIDSGVAPLPEFGDRLVRGIDLSFDAGSAAPADGFGHGTHMASIIAGRDASVVLDRETLVDAAERHYVGIAPASRIIDVKVGAADGAVDVSQVIAAIDWVVQNRNADGMNIRVLNLSYGTDGVQDYRFDPLTFAVENAWRHGIVVVVSAGNDGYGSPKLNNPAYNPRVLAVGASDTNGTTSTDDDFIADFSSLGDLTRRPDLVAPGRSVVGLRAPGSLIDEYFPSARIGDRFFRGSGSSQASAVTAGAAALLLSQFPNLTPDQVKAALTASDRQLNTKTGVAIEDVVKGLHVESAAGEVPEVLNGQIPSIQGFAPATGTGSLDAARGSERLMNSDGVVLTGEVDILGRPWDGRTWRDASWNGRAWLGRAWLGRAWLGRAWLGRSWRSAVWTGRSWRSSDWVVAEFFPDGRLR